MIFHPHKQGKLHAHGAAVSGRIVIPKPTHIMSGSVEQRSMKCHRRQLILLCKWIWHHTTSHVLSAVTGGWDPHLVVARPVSRPAKRLPKRSSLAAPLPTWYVHSRLVLGTRHGSDSHTSCSDGATRLDLALAALNLAPLVGWAGSLILILAATDR